VQFTATRLHHADQIAEMKPFARTIHHFYGAVLRRAMDGDQRIECSVVGEEELQRRSRYRGVCLTAHHGNLATFLAAEVCAQRARLMHGRLSPYITTAKGLFSRAESNNVEEHD